jgi:hypothetical protein
MGKGDTVVTRKASVYSDEMSSASRLSGSTQITTPFKVGKAGMIGRREGMAVGSC